MVIDTYSPSIEGGRLQLTRRIRRTTTATSDGTRTVEETAERNPAALGDPLRVIRRSVTRVHRTGKDAYVSERQDFEVDVNGRFIPVLAETERGSRR